jgi:hypothetical protein
VAPSCWTGDCVGMREGYAAAHGRACMIVHRRPKKRSRNKGRGGRRKEDTPPCSYMPATGSPFTPTLRQDSTSACFIDAGVRCEDRSSGATTDAISTAAPVTTGDATLVPDNRRHPTPLMSEPATSAPYATMSGFTRPYLERGGCAPPLVAYHINTRQGYPTSE